MFVKIPLKRLRVNRLILIIQKYKFDKHIENQIQDYNAILVLCL